MSAFPITSARSPSVSLIIPTRDRPERLAATLGALAELASRAGAPDAEVIIADNASELRVETPPPLGGIWPVRVLRLARNLGAAARNLAAQASDPASDWLVMLDDDSHPSDLGFVRALQRTPARAAAVMADIRLPAAGCRESGGLPEVFIGCGAAIRRDAFLEAGGYDGAFQYYAEEYDLAAKLLLRGWHVAFDPEFRVEHWKVTQKRDMDVVLARLVRNNGWVAQRYAPDTGAAGAVRTRRDELREVRRRYRAIASKEDAVRGYGRGLVELRRTVREQTRTPMSARLFDRFTGLAAAREAIDAAWRERRFDSARIVAAGKNAWAVRRALAECGVREAPEAEVRVIGTMSPGPLLDTWEREAGADSRVVSPWLVPGVAMGTLDAARPARAA